MNILEQIPVDKMILSKYSKTFCYNGDLLNAVLENFIFCETKENNISDALSKFGANKCAEIINNAMTFELQNFKVERYSYANM